MVICLCSICDALGLIPSTRRKRKKGNKIEGRGECEMKERKRRNVIK